jgi:hypothetical protein
MDSTLEKLLDDALGRKRKQCSHQTVYSHDIIKLWLKSAIEEVNVAWEVVIPVFKSKQENRKALSLWPNKKVLNAVQQWLLRHNCKDPKDFVDGACEPLALYLSTSILSSIVDGSFLNVMHSNEIARTTLKEMKSEEAAKTVFEKFINNTSTFKIWDPTNQGAYEDYLFGNEVMKGKVISALQTASSNFYMPLYVLSYLYDIEELTHAELLASTEESAQYSLHAVGLVFDQTNKRIIVADPNGALVPGSNMEFVQIPLTSRSTSTTSVSQFDVDSLLKRDSKRRKINN